MTSIQFSDFFWCSASTKATFRTIFLWYMAELSWYGIHTVKGLNFKKIGCMPTADYRYSTVHSPSLTPVLLFLMRLCLSIKNPNSEFLIISILILFCPISSSHYQVSQRQIQKFDTSIVLSTSFLQGNNQSLVFPTSESKA